MRQGLLTIGVILIALGAVGGVYVDRLLQRGEGDLELRFPDSDPKLVSAVAAGQDYGCTAVTEAETFENHLHTEGARTAPTANARSGTGADKVALKITNDGKGILLLSAQMRAMASLTPATPFRSRFGLKVSSWPTERVAWIS
jgi:hypothetical protein